MKKIASATSPMNQEPEYGYHTARSLDPTRLMVRLDQTSSEKSA